MIAVRIPEEIRKYKEKIMFGLTARQLICTVLGLLICVPLYWFGNGHINEEILSWAIILIACPLVAIGFVKINNLPMEKYAVAWFKFEILYPRKRVFKSENAFRDWQNIAIKEESLKGRAKKKADKLRKDETLEKMALLYEAEESGVATYTVGVENVTNYDVDKVELLTVRKRKGKKPRKNKKDEREDMTVDHKGKTVKKKRIQLQAEEVIKKQEENPLYVLTKKEISTMKRWHKEIENNRKKEVKHNKKEIAKKSKKMEKRRKAVSVIPNSVQKTIPYLADFEEGLFEVAPNKFSKMYEIKDINYRTGREEEQILIFCKWGEFLNYFSEDLRFAITIDNRVISKSEQERKIFYKLTGDSYDKHRIEYNNILRKQIVAGRNDIQVTKYVTVTIDADMPIEALLRFHKIDAEVITNLRKIGSDGKVLSTDERLEYYHDKYRKGREGELKVNYDFIKEQGISSKDYIAPTSFEFNSKEFRIEDGYYRCLYLNNLPASLQDDFLYNLCDNDFPVTTTLAIEPVAQEKGLRTVKKQLTSIETNKIDAEKRAIKAGYSPETIQHSIKDAHTQAEALYDDMMNKNQKMFFVTFICMVQGDTLDELNANCDIITSKARKYTSQLQVFDKQQEEAYKICLPFGFHPKDISVDRTLTTESTSILMPFSNQELFQAGGFYYGLNQISHNLVIVNRTKMKTPSGFVLGTPGSGKSFSAKREILNVLLNDGETGVLIIDPENEYGDFARVFEGVVLKISPDSFNYINPMDMPPDYGIDEDDSEDTSLAVKKDKAVKKKSDYLMSIIERMISTGGSGDATTILPQQKTIIDRCVQAVYKEYLAHDFDVAYLPTLINLQDELDKEKGTEYGRNIAEGVEYYTRGSMNIFAHHTNVDVENRLIVFNIRDLGEQLRQIALNIVFDFIWNRMIENKNKGVRTYCYCDEIHVMFQSYYSATFLNQLYKRGRKYGLCITGLTQNVEDLLKSEKAKGMIGNSDFILMLNQSSEDLKVLASMLNISDTQMSFVQGADAGLGLLFAEKVIVPFVDRFPTDSYLYKLMSTKFGEEMTQVEIDKELKSLMSHSFSS